MNNQPTSLYCLFFYLFGLVSLGMATLPADAFAVLGPGIRPEARPIALAISGICLVLGLGLHIVLYRRNPERFDPVVFWKIAKFFFIGIAITIGVSLFFSRGCGMAAPVAQQTLNGWFIVFMLSSVVLVLLLVAALYLSIKNHPANRMARRMVAGDFMGAIRIGERRPRETTDFVTLANLVSAYVKAGQKQKADDLLHYLEQKSGVPEEYTAESWGQTLERLRGLLKEEVP